ncbi:MAG: site-specific integrase, partial [Planctomycetota bacterium]|nr:site-specific integrase [Planctomycetota bacterium]
MHRVAAFPDKAASEALGRKIERLVALRAAGEAPDLELTRFISDLPTRIRDLLGKVGVLGRARVAANRTIDLLLEEFSATLRARGRTENYVRKAVRRASKAFAGSGARALPDVQGGRLERFLETERNHGMSFRTSNHYLAACRAFTKWTVEEGFLGRDPLAGLKPLNAKLDPRRERRALSFDDELPRLIRAAAEGPVYRGVTGPMRAHVYRLAAETGLRVSELVAVRVGDLELEGGRPALTLPARATKNRQEARLELRLETARELEPLIATKLPSAPLLGLPRSFKDKATRWLRFDLEAAEIPYKDDRGRVADFHALRASFVSGLVGSGANARVVQTMARHSSAELTLSIYSKLGRDDERHALERLPALPS